MDRGKTLSFNYNDTLNGKSIRFLLGDDNCLCVEVWEKDVMIPRTSGNCFAETSHFFSLDKDATHALLTCFPATDPANPLSGVREHFCVYDGDDKLLAWCRNNDQPLRSE